jgi:precorrin-6A/cobalt-precorrin-6A reductase
MSDDANPKWRLPPKTTSADPIRLRAGSLNPSMPSSPMPMTDSQRVGAGVGADAGFGACAWGGGVVPAAFDDAAMADADGWTMLALGLDMVGVELDMRPTVLILGGTTEARELASTLSHLGYTTTISLAGRTAAPAAQPVPVRVGGFGGVDGLARYLRSEHIDFLIDATHPYAATISANAVLAAAQTSTAILALRRPPWTAIEGDLWLDVAGAKEAARALGPEPKRVFLTIGRQELAPFSAAPQHHYFIRSVDPVDPPLDLPNAQYMLARGPFTESEDREFLESRSIDAIVAKNSGGDATYSKIVVARALGIPVFMFTRPAIPDCPSVATLADAVAWLDHAAGLAVPRGV